MITNLVKTTLIIILASCQVLVFGLELESNLLDPYLSGKVSEQPERRRAYEPFEELERKRAEEEARLKWKFSKDHVVIRLASKEQLESRIANGAKANEPLEDVAGIKSVSPLFPVKAIPSMAAWRAEHPVLDRWMLAEVEKGTDIKALVATLNENTLVDVAEPDYLFQLADGGPGESADPEEPQGQSGLSALPESGDANPEIDKQWHLERSKVKEAWKYLEDQGLPPGGSSDVVIAVIDSGVDYTHPDLAPNMWVNAAEIPDNGIDDDGNGIVDDIHGADFLSNSSNHNGNPTDHNGHGTHCAGIIASVADNDLGGVGVAYNSRIMAIKAAQYNGSLNSSDIAESIYYAVENGADIINMSFGSYAQSNLVIDALQSAFSQAVLIAAAGNDNLKTECLPLGPFFPASYIYVLGIMAEDENGARARFSNFDCKEYTLLEYELIAPGTKIYSTLPNENYAAWNGTSMAAPVVSGVAALVRTLYPDKSIYSSRFIMGQLAATGTKNTWFSLNAFAALSSTPQPRLTSIDYKIFDDPSLSEVNDGDGIIDSGETIELAVTVQNRWGKAEPVTVTLAAQAAGAVGPDPYITWDIDTLDYGAVGNFGYKDNGLIYSAEGAVTGVEKPFRFTVSTNTPNEHVIPIQVGISAGNGFDAEDPKAPYLFEENAFSMVVQRGRVLPSVIEEDLVMTKDNYWLVERPVFIPEGVTVTVTEGTQIQFWSPQKYDVYPNPKIQVAGSLNIEGSADNPVELFNAASLPRFYVRLHESGEGEINMNYFKILNPSSGCGPKEGRWSAWYQNDEAITKAEHGLVNQEGQYIRWYDGELKYRGPNFWSASTSTTQFKNLGHSDSGWSVFSPSNPYADQLTRYVAFPLANLDGCLITKSRMILTREFADSGAVVNPYVRNSVFLNNTSSQITEWGERIVAPSFCYRFSEFSWNNNAVLSQLWRLDDLKYHMRFYGNGHERISELKGDVNISNTFWGTDDHEVIHEMINDERDDFSIPKVEIEPVLTKAPEASWPFVTDCVLSTDLEDDVITVSAEEVTFTVTYNRDMDSEVQPKVAFGPEEPYNDFTVLGEWQDARTWVGKFKVNSITGDGYQQMRISEGVAADDAWLIAGDDVARFRFRIATAGTEALTMQASGGEGFVDLSWGQDDYELLAGYNLYRGDQRINSSIVPAGTTSFRDTDVEPGQDYDYFFKVVLTDMSESESSNTATGTPLDTIPAVISHSAINSAQPNLARTIAADITDNVSVVGATLFYRLAGSGAEYASREMVNATGDRFTVTLEGSLLQPPGVEYYLSATDGVSTTYSGRGESPYLIVVDDKPVVTGLTPNRGPASGGTVVQVTGTNFKEGSTVTFGSTLATVVTFVSSTQLEVTTPEHIPKALTVTVTNPGDRIGRLLNGYTF
ncbi:S8 family serine peptidase, partial [Akkermansiaceae bacterium]|nr:S8 family serine peptidase [Akkermansiaceae bacterium]